MNNPQEYRPKKKKTSIFFRHLEKDGKGVKKEDRIKVDEYNLKNFFKLYFRRFKEIVKINWLYIFGNFPILFMLLAISGNFSHAALAPTSQFYPVIDGMRTLGAPVSAISSMLGIHGIMGTTTVYSTLDYILLGLSALTLVTFGLVNTGCAYLLKNLVRGEHLFMWDDFITSIKQNFGKGLALGIIDIAVISLSIYSISFYLTSYNTYFVMFFCSIAVLLFYMFIRFYTYMQLVTFELSFGKLLKNSFILATLSLGRNLGTVIGIIVLAVVTLMLMSVFIPLGIIIFFMFFVSTASYICTYVSYPKMKKVMIDPYYPNYDKNTEDDDESVFEDRG